jgi:excisionase family DNA binding protein
MSNVIDLDRPTAAGTATRDRRNRPGARRAVYTVAEVSRLLSLSLGGTYELVRAGVIPGRKLGGRWIIPKRAADGFRAEDTGRNIPRLLA